jgi:hypothetical protein
MVEWSLVHPAFFLLLAYTGNTGLKGDAMSMNRVVFMSSTFLLLALLLMGCTVAAPEETPTEDATAVALAAAQVAAATQAGQTQMETAVALTIGAQTEATAEAEATAQLAATQTGVALEVAATAAAEQALAEAATATAIAEAATAAWYAQATETVSASLTARAEVAAEATAVFITQHESLINEAKARQPLYGPINGMFMHDDDGFIEFSEANVNLRNFVAEATFTLDPSVGQFEERDLGFFFRDGQSGYWELIVLRSNKWELARVYEDDYQLIKSGRLPSGTFERTNTLTLYVDETEGFFFLNGRFGGTFPLLDGQDSGDVSAASGFYERTGKKGEITVFMDFTIWPAGELAPTPTPAPIVTVAPRATAPPPGFNPTNLVNSLNNMRLTIEHMGGLLDRLYRGQSQSCEEYLGYYRALQQRTTYTGLPAEWQGIYGEYNFAAENILSTNNSIKSLCESGGGNLNDFDYGVARQGIGLSLDRINQAIQAANRLMNP